MLNINLILSVAVFFASVAANASIVKTVYKADLQAKDKSDETRAELIEQGFKEVLFKTTADSDFSNSDSVKPDTLELDKYVSSYTYYKSRDGLQLDIKFNEKMVQNLLREVGKPFIGKERPTAVVWLIVDEPGGTSFIGDKYPEVIDRINQQATASGFPVIQPLLDLSDKSMVSEDIVARFNDAPMLMASNRYGADVVIAGKISKFAGVWQSTWRILGKESVTWKDENNSLDVAVDNFMAEYSNYLVKNYAYQAGIESDEAVKLHIAGIKSIEELFKIEKFLRNIPIVSEYNVVSVNNEDAVFEVTVDGDLDDLDRAIRLNKKLKTITAASMDNSLEYRYL